MSLHVVYKSRVEDDSSPRLKAKIVPHGNEDSETTSLRSGYFMYSPNAIRVVATSALLKKWQTVKLDVEMAFHKSCPADRKVYVLPSRESKLRNELWLFLIAGYGLINANPKCQLVSEGVFAALGLKHLLVIQQLFVKINNDGVVVLLVTKIADDILACGPDDELRAFLAAFGSQFKLSIITHGLSCKRIYGM